METLLFYLFAPLTLLFGVMVIANPFSRSPVTSAMFLVLCVASMAGLFVLLHAFFLGAVQVLVYAGAVMVLFLFVIMLLDLEAEERRRFQLLGIVGGVAGAGGLGVLLVGTVLKAGVGKGLAPGQLEGSTEVLGLKLFRSYLLPFEIVSLLLLVAMVGVILLSKKDLK